MKCILHITSTGNLQFVNDIECRAAEHLILFVAKCLGRSDYDGVSGMYTNRIDVFHITYGNAIAVCIAHHFILNFFPSCDAALYEYFTDAGQTQAVGQDFNQFLLIMCNTTAGST